MQNEKFTKEEEEKMELFNRKMGELCADLGVEFMVGHVSWGSHSGTTLITRRPLGMAEVIHSCTEIVRDSREFLKGMNGELERQLLSQGGSMEEWTEDAKVPDGTTLQ